MIKNVPPVTIIVKFQNTTYAANINLLGQPDVGDYS